MSSYEYCMFVHTVKSMDASSGDVVERHLSPSEMRRAPEVGVFDGSRCELLHQLCYPLSTTSSQVRLAPRALAVHGPPERPLRLQRSSCSLSLARLPRSTPSEQISVWFSSSSGGGNESFKTSDPEAAGHATGVVAPLLPRARTGRRAR